MILEHRTGSVAWLHLNRATKCNALCLSLNQAIIDSCKRLEHDPNTSVVVLAGEGRHFCAGVDLHDLYGADRAEAERVIRVAMEACWALAALPQLIIALLHGKCLGGGAMLPLYCDLRVGDGSVILALPEVQLGWPPPYGIASLQSRLGRERALHYLLSGESCTARDALLQGWLDVLVEDRAAAEAYVQKIGVIETMLLQSTLCLTPRPDLETVRAVDEQALIAFLDAFDTEEAKRAVAGFVERRK
jgi:enoyl-CoA hydratase/carnithine racemase